MSGLFTIHDSRLPPVPAAPAELFHRLTNGLYVVTASHGGVAGGFTAAWITQVSFAPLLVGVSINPGNATWRLVENSGCFVVNVLAVGQLEVARRFGTSSGRDVDKLAGVAVRSTASGIVLTDSVAWLECQVEQAHPAGDHVVVIARATAGDLLNPAAPPMRYSDTGDLDGSASLFPAEWPRP